LVSLLFRAGLGKGEERRAPAMEAIECTRGHYEVQEVDFGTVYRWCPECVVVECDCGQRTTLTRLESIRYSERLC